MLYFLILFFGLSAITLPALFLTLHAGNIVAGRSFIFLINRLHYYCHRLLCHSLHRSVILLNNLQAVAIWYKKSFSKKIPCLKIAIITLLAVCINSYTNAQVTDTSKTGVRISEILTDEEINEDLSTGDEEGNTEEDTRGGKYQLINREFRKPGFNDSTGKPLYQRNIASAVKDSFKQQGDFWYLNPPPGKNKTSGKTSPLGKIDWLEPFLWILIIGGFLVFIIWWYVTNGQGSFLRRNPTAFTAVDETHEIPEDIFAINYASAIGKAVANNDYRLAVRLMYLQVLANMHHRHIIQYKQDATNFDYLMHLHQTGYYAPFFKVTRHYEYAWYGQFPVSEQAFNLIKQDVEKLNQTINYR